MSDVILELEHVRVQFDKLMAVNDVTLTLRGGELLGMIGPNGAGKTTTLRAAAGLQPTTTGDVRVMGRTLDLENSAARQIIGFTPDTPAVYDNITVVQYLTFIGECYRMDAPLIRERIDVWLQQLWLTEKRSQRIGSLSRGMKQRLAVARTLLPDPVLILLDEPAAGLDPAGRAQFRQLLANLRDQGKAIIVSSHILADLADYCTHVLIMEHGRVLRSGAVHQIAAADGEATPLRHRVVLVQRVGDLESRLEPFAALHPRIEDGDRFTLDLPHDRAIAAATLRRLLDSGMAVADFRSLPADLEQAYLQSGIAQVD